MAPKASRAPAGPLSGCEQAPLNELIRVDQFGYRPEQQKVAILVDPVEGWNKTASFTPGDAYEVRSWTDGKLAFSGKPQVWNGGAAQNNAGDRGWWFDFSALKGDGSYCVFDANRRARSHRFEVKATVYRDVLRAAFKAFYFNRANFKKQKPHACVGEKCWLSDADYLGPGQDSQARSVKDRANAKTARDLSGGWWDAGDVNKYVTFLQAPMHQLLTAYTDKPSTFGDDFGIPESGNGLPDLVDELKIELDWLKKMQPSDLGGGVLLKLGNVDYGDPIPEKSRLPRFYYPEPCSSASVTAAGIFAHAALVLRGVSSLKAYADDLGQRAARAMAHFQAHPKSSTCDDGTIKSGDADKTLEEQDQVRVVAAIYLYALTGDKAYDETVKQGYTTTRPFKEDRWSAYDPDQGDALLFYTTLPGADAGLKSAILKRKLEQSLSVDIYGMKPALDLYRAYLRDDSYHWGSNMVRANLGNTNYDLVQLGLSKGDEAAGFIERAAGLLHSFHGVNAVGLVYLSNMTSYGAEKSASEIYHAWFRDGDPNYDSAETSRLGPAPGYVPGGPNKSYCKGQDPNQHKCAVSRLSKQPAQKAYLDFNTAWDPGTEHDRSWEVTEPAIYYQASYIKLLSKFVD